MPLPTSAPRRRLRSPAILATCAILAGVVGACLPIPHTERVSPAFSGVIRRADGTGIAGVTIGNSCVGPGDRTTTDSLGRFALPEGKQHFTWLLVMGDKVVSYGLCAFEGDSGTRIYDHWSTTAPRSQELECTALLRPLPMTTCRPRE